MAVLSYCSPAFGGGNNTQPNWDSADKKHLLHSLTVPTLITQITNTAVQDLKTVLWSFSIITLINKLAYDAVGDQKTFRCKAYDVIIKISKPM